MLISLLWIPTYSNIFRKKIQELNSGTRCHSCFFKEHFLHLISQEALHPNLSSSQKIRTKENVHFYALCFTLFSSVSTLADISRWAAAQEEGCCDFVALAEVLSEWSTDDLTASVPPPQCNNEHQAALHAQTAMTCKNTPPFKEQDTQTWLARIFSNLHLLGANAEKLHN